jgi:hypothetical protein
MKLDGATIAIEPRSIGACVDLAVLFTGAHAGQIVGLTLICAVPTCVVTYVMVDRLDASLVLGLLLFFVMSPWLGAALVAGAGHRVFGDPFTVSGTCRILPSRFFPLFFALLLSRIAIAATSPCVVPIPLLAVRYGFLSEIILLEQSRGFQFERRTSDLMRGTFFDLVTRFFVVIAFYMCIFVSLFILVDLTSGIVFGMPILFGRLTSGFFIDDIQFMLMHDPLVVTAIGATLWLAYPLARLTWFFCYLDTRIRKEAWDIELDFRIESQRLAAVREAQE